MTFRIGTPFSRGAGYFVNDKELKSRQEADVQTCSHCQRVIFMQAWKEDGGFCHRCMHPICGPCATRAMTYGCEPFLKRIEQHAERLMRFERLQQTAEPGPVASPLILTGEKE